MKINTSKKSGFTLVEIMIVVAIIGLLAAIAIPNFVRARKTAQANSCINNMRLIDSAIQQIQLEQPALAAAGIDQAALTPYLGRGTGAAGAGGGQFPRCPTTDTSAAYTLAPGATPSVECANTTGDFPHVLPQ
jgi:prepilin-type N-terminal cleavage/methylation domain-containing protein